MAQPWGATALLLLLATASTQGVMAQANGPDFYKIGTKGMQREGDFFFTVCRSIATHADPNG